MRTPRLLITGFGPFPRMPVNPSAVLAQRVAAAPRLRRVLGAAPHLLVLRTAYAAIPTQLEPALAQNADAVLMIGVASRAQAVRVETRACNRASRLFPDVSGATACRLTLDPDGPFARRSPAASRVAVTLRGIGAVTSQDAGRYLCNASYYRVLAQGCPTVFLHIPPLPRSARPIGSARLTSPRQRRTLEAWTDAFVETAVLLATHTRRWPCPQSRAGRAYARKGRS